VVALIRTVMMRGLAVLGAAPRWSVSRWVAANGSPAWVGPDHDQQ